MGDFGQTQSDVNDSVYNGIPAPGFSLPLADTPDLITTNLLALVGQAPNPRHRFIYQHLIKYLHAFVRETNITTAELWTAIEFLTRVTKECPPGRQDMVLLAGVLGVSALVELLNNPVEEGATESSPLGPFFTEDAEDIEHGGSITSQETGPNLMYVEGRVLNTNGEPIANAVIETWESDHNGVYDVQYPDRTRPDCRGRLRTGKDGEFGYRAIVPVSYPVGGCGPVHELLISQGRHNMRPNHLHLVVDAPGYRKLTTALYPEGCEYMTSDVVFAVKKPLLVKLEEINDKTESRKRGFVNGGLFKLLRYDIVLLTEEQSSVIQKRTMDRVARLSFQGKDE